MDHKLVWYIKLGVYGTKEELDDAEDFFPFIYVPVNIHWESRFNIKYKLYLIKIYTYYLYI